jgi:transglutaminase-like putative cysteine protease
MRFDIRNRTVFTYTGQVVESQNELRARSTTTASGCSTTASPSARPPCVQPRRLLGHPGRLVRHPSTAHLDGGRRRGIGRARPRPLPTAAPRFEALARPDFIDAHIEYLQVDSHTAYGDGVRAAAERQRELAGPDVVGVVLSVHRFVGSTIVYQVGATEVGTPVEDVLAGGAGVCQDYAHLAVAMCRSLGIPARYVSGYLFTDDDSVGDAPGADAVLVQTHAWFEAAIPGWGWLALDPTNGQLVGERHVAIGHGRSYDDVQPQRGVFLGPADSQVQPAVEIRRVAGGELWRPAPGLHLDEPLAGGGVFPAQPVSLVHGLPESRPHQQQQQQQ